MAGALQVGRWEAPEEAGVGACEGGSGSEEEGFVMLNRIVCDGK